MEPWHSVSASQDTGLCGFCVRARPALLSLLRALCGPDLTPFIGLPEFSSAAQNSDGLFSTKDSVKHFVFTVLYIYFHFQSHPPPPFIEIPVLEMFDQSSFSLNKQQ